MELSSYIEEMATKLIQICTAGGRAESDTRQRIVTLLTEFAANIEENLDMLQSEGTLPPTLPPVE